MTSSDEERPNTPPTSLQAPISPPRSRRSKSHFSHVDELNPGVPTDGSQHHSDINAPTPASIEAGEIQIQDHLSYFSAHLARVVRPQTPGPRLSIPDFVDLYQRNYHPHGRHFVVHQHDHPVAGLHYDLRLQISETSSISFAIMYGLPGNPNSRRLNRNATETRVHCLWNHLIETASSSTGSMLIWDTGEYSILPYHSDQKKQTDNELSTSSSNETHQPSTTSESSKLHRAFKNHKIRLRLHGTHLPADYTLSLRLPPSNNRHSQPKPPVRKRRRGDPGSRYLQRAETPSSSNEKDVIQDDHSSGTTTLNATTPPTTQHERSMEQQSDEQIRLSNAYPGATNSIHSIHQRRWYLSIDRHGSGFTPFVDGDGVRRWVRRRDEDGDGLLGFEPFFVRGRDHERSVVTGRTAEEVMGDEGVEGFEGRKGWRAVLE
ncbi:MAG: hypothetical protein Q9199_002749 [Rusavskia elegans]